MTTEKAKDTITAFVAGNESADEAVQDRQGRYGHPKENFGRTAVLWSAFFELRTQSLPLAGRGMFATADVPAMMILLKMAREMHGHDPDNLVDIAGYAKTWQMLYGEA